MIEVKDLKYTVGGKNIIDGLNLTVNTGESVGIIGPSGTGKSTLLKCMVMLAKATDGAIYFDGEKLTDEIFSKPEFSGKIGMVFQDFNLFSHMTVVENVMSGLVHLKNMDRQTAFNEAMDIIKWVGLYDKAFDFTKGLSGGEKQRVAIARTLAMKPDVILMDEPTSSLDPVAKGEVEAVIGMIAEKGTTMIIVSHETELLRNVCTRAVFLSDGKVVEEGTPAKLFDDPQNEETRRFVHALRVLELTVDSDTFDFIGLQTTLTEYAYRTGAASTLLLQILSVLEELFHIIIIDSDKQNKMHISLEYSNKTKSVIGTVMCTGDKLDTDDPMNYLSWRIIEKRVNSMNIGYDANGEYANRIDFELK